jgi:hypothetical protein
MPSVRCTSAPRRQMSFTDCAVAMAVNCQERPHPHEELGALLSGRSLLVSLPMPETMRCFINAEQGAICPKGHWKF